MKEIADYRTELKQCETIIERNLNTFIEVGTALLQIRDNRLYRDTHKTFEAYCRERWGWSKTHVNRQIQAAEVAENLTPRGVILGPTSEKQLRPLVKLPPPEQRHVWTQAVEKSNGRAPTAAAVEQARNQYQKPKREVPNIHAFVLKLVNDINAILDVNDSLVERLNEVLKSKDDLGEVTREDLVKTLEIVANRFFKYAQQFGGRKSVENLHIIEGERVVRTSRLN